MEVRSNLGQPALRCDRKQYNWIKNGAEEGGGGLGVQYSHESHGSNCALCHSRSAATPLSLVEPEEAEDMETG